MHFNESFRSCCCGCWYSRLTAAILSKQGLSVTLIESHTYQGDVQAHLEERIIFDVGAPVAGLEKVEYIQEFLTF